MFAAYCKKKFLAIKYTIMSNNTKYQNVMFLGQNLKFPQKIFIADSK